jgi:hypothetical protein
MPRRWLQGSAQGFNLVSTLGTLKINEFALKGREADQIKLAPIVAQKLERAIEVLQLDYFRVASTFDLPPLQGESLWAVVPRVETWLKPWAESSNPFGVRPGIAHSRHKSPRSDLNSGSNRRSGSNGTRLSCALHHPTGRLNLPGKQIEVLGYQEKSASHNYS